MAASEPIEISFVLSEREFASGLRRVTFRNRALLIGTGAAVLLLLLGVLLLSWVPLTSGAAVILIFCWAFIFQPRQQWRRQPRRNDEQRYTFSNDGVDVATPAASAAFGWDVYAEVVETSDVYVLKTHSRICNFVPRRAFTPEQEKAFRTLVSGKRKAGLLTSNIEQAVVLPTA